MAELDGARGGSGARIRVVVVGEDPADAEAIRKILSHSREPGFAVTYARGLDEVVALMAREPCHVLLWDFRLSDAAGFETLERVKAVAARVPAVVMAESDDAAHALQALRIGVQDYLIRGETEPASLSRSLRHAIERHRLLAQLRVAGAHARFLATHDGLTRLANRSAFQAYLGRATAYAERRGTRLAVLFLDLDGFKHINDTLGHSVGDELIQQVAGRLQACVRKSDLLARLGGDEFVVMIQDADQEHAPARVAETLLDRLAAPFVLGGREYWVTASIGISVYPRDGADRDSLIRNADAAMYKAKSLGRNNYQFYSQSMGPAAQRRLDLERKLRRAFDERQLEIHYQPIVDLPTARITGAEALLRWSDPELGVVPAEEVVLLAEETGLIKPLGAWVLETACRDARAWQRAGFPDMRVLVNVSTHQLQQGELREAVVRTLWDTGLRPEHLDLELTETAFMRKEAVAFEVLQELKQMGVELSLDDFGTGFSSLSYLKRIPVDTVKIDQSFVRDITVDPDDAAITAAILSIAEQLDLKVIAEGVESIEQRDLLRARGCRAMQGFLFSQAVPADALRKLLRPGTLGALVPPVRDRRSGSGQPSR